MVISVDRKAKFLMIKLIDDTVILSHLGMSGRWTIISEDFESTPGRFAHGGVIGTGDGPHDGSLSSLRMEPRPSILTLADLDSLT